MNVSQFIETCVPSKPMLTREEVAGVLGVPRLTLAHWACQKKGPSYLKLGRIVRYPRAAVVAWLMDQAAKSASNKPLTDRAVDDAAPAVA